MGKSKIEIFSTGNKRAISKFTDDLCFNDLARSVLMKFDNGKERSAADRRAVVDQTDAIKSEPQSSIAYRIDEPPRPQPDLLEDQFFAQLQDRLAEAIGPAAFGIIDYTVAYFGHDFDSFPVDKAGDLIKKIAQEISSEEKRFAFLRQTNKLIDPPEFEQVDPTDIDGCAIIEHVEEVDTETEATRLDESFFDYLDSQMSIAVGPISRVLIDDVLAGTGCARDNFPNRQAIRLIDSLSAEIIRPEKKHRFKKRMVAKLNGNAPKFLEPDDCDVLDADAITALVKGFALFVGPFAKVIVRDAITELGYPIDCVPRHSASKLVTRLGHNIAQDADRAEFQRLVMPKLTTGAR